MPRELVCALSAMLSQTSEASKLSFLRSLFVSTRFFVHRERELLQIRTDRHVYSRVGKRYLRRVPVSAVFFREFQFQHVRFRNHNMPASWLQYIASKPTSLSVEEQNFSNEERCKQHCASSPPFWALISLESRGAGGLFNGRTFIKKLSVWNAYVYKTQLSIHGYRL